LLKSTAAILAAAMSVGDRTTASPSLADAAAVVVATGKSTGYDRVRNTEIGNKEFELEVLEEAYTTEHWLVRIYKVKDLTNRGH